MIAVKARHESKGRLAQAMTGAARLDLVRAMLRHVIAVSRAARCVGRVIVVSPERDQVPADIVVLADVGNGLNSAVAGAREALHSLAVRRLIILPADLPTLQSADIEALAAAGRAGGVAIAPDREGDGTNGLYLDGVPDFTFCFGAGSRAGHAAEALRHGHAAALVHSPGLAFDVDRPQDLWEYGSLCKQDRQQA